MNESSSLTNNIDVFELEDLRNKLARRMKRIDFLRTYSDKYPKIDVKNTGLFWDKKNFVKRISSHTNPMAFDRIQRVCRFISSLGKIKMLDVGFGPADLERRLYKSKILLSGVDISKKSVDLARMEFKRWKFINGNLLNIKIKTKFDALVALEVLEHIQPSDNQSFLKKAFGLLNNRGWLVVSVPLNEELREMIRENRNLNRHVRLYTLDTVKYEIALSGFRVVKTDVLYAFDNGYKLKTLICKIIPKIKNPNNVIIYSQKK